MSSEASPRPWRTGQSPIGSNTWIVSGEIFVASASRAADAALIVDAINNADSWRSACIKARTERNAFLLECDRLRDLVGRLAQRIQFARLADPNPGGGDPLLREAAAVCKKKGEET